MWIQISMASHHSLILKTSNTIKRVEGEASVGCVQYLFHYVTKHIIDRGVQTKSIYNLYETVFCRKIMTKIVINCTGVKEFGGGNSLGLI